jgi:hypothetical protein
MEKGNNEEVSFWLSLCIEHCTRLNNLLQINGGFSFDIGNDFGGILLSKMKK